MPTTRSGPLVGGDCPLGAVTWLSAGGGALPVIMSIIGPRETHDYRNCNLLVRGTISSKKTRQNKLGAAAGLHATTWDTVRETRGNKPSRASPKSPPDVTLPVMSAMGEGGPKAVSGLPLRIVQVLAKAVRQRLANLQSVTELQCITESR